jgi:hypothetical protein
LLIFASTRHLGGGRRDARSSHRARTPLNPL